MRLDYIFPHLDMNGNKVGCMEGAKGSPKEPPKQSKNGKNGKNRLKEGKLKFLDFSNVL